MSQHVTLRVLRARFPQMHADAPVGDRGLTHAPVLDRQAAQQHEPPPVQHLLPDVVQHGFEGG